MLTKEQVNTLRLIAQNPMTETDAVTLHDVASSIDNTVRIDADRDAKYKALQDIGKSAAESIAEMVAALECDYARLAELRDYFSDPENYANADAGNVREDKAELGELEKAAGECQSEDGARQRIEECPLSIELAGTWTLGSTPEADRAYILLGTGGPATRIVCELNGNMEPTRAWIEAQDWGTPWTEYRGDAISSDDLLTYCRCFYFGEG